MRSYLWPVTVMFVLLSVTASFAGDVVFMPTGNSVAKGKFEYNFIFVDLDPPAVVGGSSATASPRSLGRPPKNLLIHEFFFGATDRLEIDVNVLDPDGADAKVEINPYLTLVKESPNRPSFIVGVYNLFGENFPTRPGGDSRVSPFFVSSYNIHTPAAAPSLSDPLVRGHLGWGTGQHDSDFLGGAQFLVHPKIGGAVYTYHGDMAYIGVYRPKKCLEFRAGTLGGDEWGSFGVFVDW